MEKNAKKIEVQMRYNWIFPIVLGCVLIFFIFLPQFAFKNTEGQLVAKIFWYSIMSGGAVFCFIFASSYFQIGIIAENGIRLKSLFRTIIFIEWKDIKKIEIDKLPTMSSSTFKNWSYSWIVIYTSLDQNVKYGGVNKHKKGPWQIKATNKNIQIIDSFIKSYCPQIKFDSDIM